MLWVPACVTEGAPEPVVCLLDGVDVPGGQTPSGVFLEDWAEIPARSLAESQRWQWGDTARAPTVSGIGPPTPVRVNLDLLLLFLGAWVFLYTARVWPLALSSSSSSVIGA